jgi:hypothetical protein
MAEHGTVQIRAARAEEHDWIGELRVAAGHRLFAFGMPLAGMP